MTSNTRSNPLRRRVRAGLVVAVLCLIPAAALAQPASLDRGARAVLDRGGFWLRIGYGASGLDLTCDLCGDIDREWDLGGYFGIGGTVSDNVQIGLGSISWTETQDFELGAGVAGFTAVIYPQPMSNFFLQVGGGAAYVADIDLADSEFGPGLLAGVGADLPLSRGFGLTLYGGFAYGWLTDADVDLNIFQIALGIVVP